MVNKQLMVAILLCLLGSAVSAQPLDDDAPSNILFRYTDERGSLVVEQSIPPAAAAGGYEIITESGRVLKKVPKALSGEDAVKYAERLRREAHLAEWDAKLKRRYSSIKDIESAKKRSLSELTGNLAILRSNLTGVVAQLETQQRQAGVHERNGRKIPATTLENIANLENEQVEVRKQIAAREAELAERAAAFDKDIERFRVILGQSNAEPTP
ncbi:hypothetical protein KO507_02260 [Gilvimarinus agarilyticus]|uniref:hypothetical protein n=1 Tax=unclassified Gilvimarinus TaxID=2642066 RepID=UPI001C0A2770|nr:MULTISPECIES: hypothetical protein [unclassified Gilvimarinus]MBU2884582.1 hypothetical protein [Gilvimarinus agarilyticus]MDO6569691.1 hypothetical protein [Gilvimarinus sp. 2_MG-2023]MDO6748067.1 hypothetical protein [Gilvimarinus sp. 1_MG-2023]